MSRLLTRDEFRASVLRRDGYKCILCGDVERPGVRLDAHHIMERRLFSDGGYYLDNGATLCDRSDDGDAGCHMKAEQTLVSCEELRDITGSLAVLPEHLYRDQKYDKWANPILDDGRRLRGELFHDESVQKVLSQVLHLFTDRVKYPRTYHLPNSPGATSDDRIMKDPDRCFEDREIVVTEKMDGENCVAGHTRVTMADGSQRTIRDLIKSNAVGTQVMGRDDNGRLAPAKITRVYDNGSTEDWLQIRIKGYATPNRLTYCTDKHRFFTPDRGYVEAGELRAGDRLIDIRFTDELTQIQTDVLLGSLLGDGSLHVHHEDTALVQVGHKKDHETYVDWTAKVIGSIARGKSYYTSGFGSEMVKLSTACNHAIFKKFGSMIVDGKKTVPGWVADKLTMRAIAHWYMDDGYLLHTNKQRDRMQFSVCGFTESDCDVLQAGLRKHGIESKQKVWSGYRYIVVDADDTWTLATRMSPFIPDVMRYKLPAWANEIMRAAPVFDVEPKQIAYTRETVVLGIERKSHRVDRIRYDLETETHNYFANDTLVHNCTMYRDYIHARSLEYSPHPSRDRVKAMWANVAHDIPEGWRVCGENLYALHSIAYDDLASYFQVFSVWTDSNECLSWDETKEWASLLGFRTVQELGRGPWKPDSAWYHGAWAAHCLLNLGRESEGYVVRNAAKFHYKDFRNNVAKYVRAGHVVHRDGHWSNRPVTPNKLKSL